MIKDMNKVLDATRRCGRLCNAPGWPKNSSSCQPHALTPVPREDGLSDASKASERVAWSGTVSIAMRYESGDAAAPTKYSLRLSGAELQDGGVSAAAAACRAYALAPEACQVLTDTMNGAAKGTEGPAGEDLDQEHPHDPDARLVLVTAASHSFFGAVKNLVGSVHFWEKALPVVVYDIGLTPQERSEVRGWHGVALRTLPWSRHPPHVRDLFKYAWKPLAIADALSRCQGDTIMLYQDAGQELRQPLAELLRTVPIQGHLFPAAGVPAITATHPATLAFLNTSAEELDRGSVQMALGGNLAMVCGSKGTKAHTVIEAAVACALEEKCIAPPGASTSTHAFDQSVLSVLLHKAGILPSNEWRWMV